MFTQDLSHKMHYLSICCVLNCESFVAVRYNIWYNIWDKCSWVNNFCKQGMPLTFIICIGANFIIISSSWYSYTNTINIIKDIAKNILCKQNFNKSGCKIFVCSSLQVINIFSFDVILTKIGDNLTSFKRRVASIHIHLIWYQTDVYEPFLRRNKQNIEASNLEHVKPQWRKTRYDKPRIKPKKVDMKFLLQNHKTIFWCSLKMQCIWNWNSISILWIFNKYLV